MGNTPAPPFEKQTQARPGLDTEMTPVPQIEDPNYKPSGKLAGKAALITGGDSGIGAAVAVLFAREGADVAIAYLPEERSDADRVLGRISELGRRGLGVAGDIQDSAFCDHLVERTVETFGRLDVLVNNAAYMQIRESLEEITDEDLDRVFRTNIYAYFYMARAALRHMKSGSTIINTGSVAGQEGVSSILDYASTKAAIHAFTKGLAGLLIDRQIRVNCVAPGPVWTPLNASARPPEQMAEYGSQVPMGRPGQPYEMAPAYVFFASNPDSSYISGEVLSLFGGKTQNG